jgi:biotin/methionine sulfoxide reductase
MPYLTGETDGQPKDAAWAANITGVPADTIRGLARCMAAERTMPTAAWSLQRADHGEQPYWALVLLAACLGQIGLPGGGFGFGYGSAGGIAEPPLLFPGPAMPTLANPAGLAIPAARIADCLLHPGERYDYNGNSATYPDIRLAYWAGGNPFHHHQDLNRLRRAWQRPETIIVHEPWWTATARHADIVLPATTTLERNDVGCSPRDRFVIAMHQAIDPVGEATFCAIWRVGSAAKTRLPRDATRRPGSGTSTTSSASARRAISFPSSSRSGKRAGSKYRHAPTSTCCSRISAPILTSTGCAHRRDGSNCIPS